MVLGIAHQGCGRLCSSALPKGFREPHVAPSQKIRMAPCRASIPLPFPMPHAGSCLVDRRAMPPLTTDQPPRTQRKRHEKTLLTLLTLCEACSFVGFVDGGSPRDNIWLLRVIPPCSLRSHVMIAPKPPHARALRPRSAR